MRVPWRRFRSQSAQTRVDEWLGSCEYRKLRADHRVQRVREVLSLEDIEQSELLDTLDPIFDSLKSGSERFPEPSGPPLEYLAGFAMVVCDAIGERGLLGPQDLRQLRMNAWLGFAHAQVHYYRSLLKQERRQVGQRPPASRGIPCSVAGRGA